MRDQILREAKATLRQWFRERDDAYLTRAVGECREGTFAFHVGCRCLIGLLAERPTYGFYSDWKDANGYGYEMHPVESALYKLGGKDYALLPRWEPLRRVRTLPIVLAEIKKRHRVPTAPPVEVACE